MFMVIYIYRRNIIIISVILAIINIIIGLLSYIIVIEIAFTTKIFIYILTYLHLCSSSISTCMSIFFKEQMLQ